VGGGSDLCKVEVYIIRRSRIKPLWYNSDVPIHCLVIGRRCCCRRRRHCPCVVVAIDCTF
jgi:hypothetical protein